jgi:exopolyphosphatase/pppGpp-phosphohydrolase
VADRLAERVDIDVGEHSTVVSYLGADVRLPVGPRTLLADELVDPDPPSPAQLTNAIGLVTDHFDDVLRAEPGILHASDVHLHGDEARHLAVVEQGGDVAGPVAIERDAVEDVFRTLAVEPRAARLHNPGLDPSRVDSVLGACCVVVAVMRRLRLPVVTFDPPARAA